MTERSYRREMGDRAYDRQQHDLSARCPHCWAMPGQPHVRLCPDYDGPEQPEQLAVAGDDQEPLF